MPAKTLVTTDVFVITRSCVALPATFARKRTGDCVPAQMLPVQVSSPLTTRPKPVSQDRLFLTYDKPSGIASDTNASPSSAPELRT